MSKLLDLFDDLTGVSTQNNGSGAAHNNTQPTLVMNKIIHL